MIKTGMRYDLAGTLKAGDIKPIKLCPNCEQECPHIWVANMHYKGKLLRGTWECTNCEHLHTVEE